MVSCSNCGWSVDRSAGRCPSCGKNDPTDFNANVGFVIFIGLAILFLTPSIVFIWPFSFGWSDAIETALKSPWAWTGSSAFWGSLLTIYALQDSDNRDIEGELGLRLWLPLVLYVAYRLLCGSLAMVGIT